MKGVKDFLPLLLLAVATRAIPLPEPRSIAMVSAYDATVEWDGGTHEGAIDKRAVRGDTPEAELESVTTEMTESETGPAESEAAEEPEKDEENDEPAEEADQGMTTTEEAAADGAATEETEEPKEEEEEKMEEEEEKMEEVPEDSPAEEEPKEEEAMVEEEEGKAQEEQPVTEEAMDAKPEDKKVMEEEKVDGRTGDEGKQDGMVPAVLGGGAGIATPVAPQEGRPIFAFGPPPNVHGPPYPWHFPPLPLDLPIDGFPDHPVQQVGNEVHPQGKVVFPIYLIRFDHRYLHEPAY